LKRCSTLRIKRTERSSRHRRARAAELLVVVCVALGVPGEVGVEIVVCLLQVVVFVGGVEVDRNLHAELDAIEVDDVDDLDERS
jgi:hypothetical protein